MGIGRNDRVAIVLPNGPDMATAFVAIACGATTAPLNPAYRAEEFDFYLSDLNAKALVILDGMESPARRGGAGAQHSDRRAWCRGAARRRFHACSRAPCAARRRAAALREADDIALVLHTSGTTSRPKIVPLTHTNVTASAYHIGRTLALTPDDVCLNIMPLFHIHGLIAATLSSLAAGASVVCTPGFNALKFFAWFEEAKPDLVHGGADHASGDPDPRRAQHGDHRKRPAALHPLVVLVAAAAGDGGAGKDLRRAGDRGLWHDRGLAPDGVQSAAARARALPAASASPPAPTSRSWTRTASCCRPARWARS